jgi:hypothetical protein
MPDTEQRLSSVYLWGPMGLVARRGVSWRNGNWNPTGGPKGEGAFEYVNKNKMCDDTYIADAMGNVRGLFDVATAASVTETLAHEPGMAQYDRAAAAGSGSAGVSPAAYLHGNLVVRTTYNPCGKPFIEKLDATANEGAGDWVARTEPTGGLPVSSVANPFGFTGRRHGAAVSRSPPLQFAHQRLVPELPAPVHPLGETDDAVLRISSLQLRHPAAQRGFGMGCSHNLLFWMGSLSERVRS